MSHYEKVVRERDRVDRVLAHLQNEHSAYHSASNSLHADTGVSVSSGSSGTSVILEMLRKPWVAPMDAWKLKSPYKKFGYAKSSQAGSEDDDSISPENTPSPPADNASDDASVSTTSSDKIVNLAQLQIAVLATRQVSVTAKVGRRIPKRVMLPFKHPMQAFPASVPLCPDIQALEDAFGGSSLHIDVHSIAGFNFTSEFESVYKAKTNATTSYQDFISTCHRGLLVFDPSIDPELAQQYCVYMGRMAFWERSVSVLACAEALKTTAPDLKAEVMDKEPHPSLKILIGRDRVDQSLCFWVRICPRLKPTAIKSMTPEAKKAEMAAHIALHFCYYRKFTLSKARLDEFERNQKGYFDWKARTSNAKGSLSSAPPPPPRPPLNDSWYVYLICRQNVPVADPNAPTADTELYDELDVEDQDATADYAMNAQGGARGGDSIATGAGFTGVSGFTGFTGFTRNDGPIGPPLTKVDPSPCSELVGWGYNADYSLGLGKQVSLDSEYRGVGARTESDDIHRPRPVSLPSSLTLERIATIACSPRHTLVLSCMGNIYVCGENSEGALGLGNLSSKDKLTLLQWPEDPEDLDRAPPKIVKISAGSGSIGSHSMCIDSDGMLYGWGVPQAVGHGGVKPVLAPVLIDTFPSAVVQSHPDDPNAPARDEEADDGDFLEGGASSALPCMDVSCGGGFTVAVLHDGRVCSWGIWSHGRLGQGPTPDTRGYKSRGKKLARYKMRPGFVGGIKNAVAAACGEAHALCLLSTGEVRAWGQNSCGQLGIGPNYVGMLRDMMHPVTVFPFVGSQNKRSVLTGKRLGQLPTVFEQGDDATMFQAKDGPTLLAATIGCGAYHSAIIDTNGAVYTFGARGAFCLGHNDPFLNGDWADRTNSVFSVSTNAVEVQIPFELLPWCKMWSRPRRVVALESSVVRSFSAGDLHSAFLCENGHLYVCGTGPVSPPIASASLQQESKEKRKQSVKKSKSIASISGTAAEETDMDVALSSDEGEKDDDEEGEGEDESVISFVSEDDESDEDDDAGEVLRKRGVRRSKHEYRKRGRLEELIATKASIVRTPRRPSATWLDAICTKKVVHVASSGTRCFTILDEENVVPALTASLLRRTLIGTSQTNDNFTDADDITLDSYRPRNDEESYGSYFAQRGRADCMLLVSGKVLLCHKALLSVRSPELRDMIVQEQPADEYTINGQPQPTQLLLPELHVDSARALLAFLYTDILPRRCLGNAGLLRALQRASKTLRIPRLQILCERLLKCLSEAELARSDDMAWVDISAFDLPPPTLARDLGALVGDPEYADVRFVAEGRTLHAHRFILESRSEYFRTMFRSSYVEGFRDGNSSGAATSVDVVVPDTFVGFLRLLIFMYTDTLPDGSDAALLEDLICADRYDMEDMRNMCESMLVPSEDNWLDILQAADMLDSTRLQLEVEGFVRDNFSVVCPDEDFSPSGMKGNVTMTMLRDEFPEFLDRVFEDRVDAHPLPPSHIFVESTKENMKASGDIDKVSPFPMWALVGGLVAFFLYIQTAKIVTLGPVVPVINVLFIGGCLLYLFRFIFTKPL